MDSGAAGHVMPEGMFPRLRLERKTAPKNLVAANGEHIRDLGEQTIPVRTKMHNIQKCERCQAYHFNAECCPTEKHCGAG